MFTRNTLTMLAIAAILAVAASAQAAVLVDISHDGTSGAEASPFDTKVLSNGTDWTYTTDGGRTVMTALDNNTSTTINGGDNRLILVETDGVSQFNDTGTAADKGWVFEIELELLAGESQTANGDHFVNFGVRSENDAGKTSWIGLNEISNQIGFVRDNGGPAGEFYASSSLRADLDVASMIDDGNYYNFKIHKYDNAGNTTVDVFMDGSLVLSGLYSDLEDDGAGRADIQGFGSATPVPSSQVNIDYVNFTLYDNLTESTPIPEPSSLLLALVGLGLLAARRRR